MPEIDQITLARLDERMQQVQKDVSEIKQNLHESLAANDDTHKALWEKIAEERQQRVESVNLVQLQIQDSQTQTRTAIKVLGAVMIVIQFIVIVVTALLTHAQHLIRPAR